MASHPISVNNDLAWLCNCEINYGTEHEHYEVLAWPQLLFSIGIHRLHLEKPCRVVCIYVVLCLLLRLLHWPGENKYICSSYGSLNFLAAS